MPVKSGRLIVHLCNLPGISIPTCYAVARSLFGIMKTFYFKFSVKFFFLFAWSVHWVILIWMKLLSVSNLGRSGFRKRSILTRNYANSGHSDVRSALAIMRTQVTLMLGAHEFAIMRIFSSLTQYLS